MSWYDPRTWSAGDVANVATWVNPYTAPIRAASWGAHKVGLTEKDYAHEGLDAAGRSLTGGDGSAIDWLTGKTSADEMKGVADTAAAQQRALAQEMMGYGVKYGQDVFNRGQLGAQNMYGMGQAEGNKMLAMGQQAGDKYAAQWDRYGQQLDKQYGAGGAMGGPGYAAQRYQQSQAGDPYYQRLAEQGMNQIAQQAAARGGLRSGATGRMQGNYLAGVTADRQHQLDSLASAADASEQSRIGQMMSAYGQEAGGRMAGQQAGLGQGIAGYGSMVGQGMQGWGNLYGQGLQGYSGLVGAGMGAYGQQAQQGINAQMQGGMYGPQARENFKNQMIPMLFNGAMVYGA